MPLTDDFILFFGLDPDSFTFSAKQMDNKGEPGSSTKIVFWVILFDGSLFQETCPFLLAECYCWKVMHSVSELSLQCTFSVFLLGRDGAFAKLEVLSNLFWHNTWIFAWGKDLKIELNILCQPSIFVLFPKKIPIWEQGEIDFTYKFILGSKGAPAKITWWGY